MGSEVIISRARVLEYHRQARHFGQFRRSRRPTSCTGRGGFGL